MANKYSFINYDPDDIRQEAFLMCVNAIPKYNGLIPLEHFLLHHLSNRLKNLKRDKANAKHAKIIYASPIHCIPQDSENFLIYDQLEENIYAKELSEKIDSVIPAEYREYYLMLINGKKIPHQIKVQIRKIVSEVLYG